MKKSYQETWMANLSVEIPNLPLVDSGSQHSDELKKIAAPKTPGPLNGEPDLPPSLRRISL
jgi:hypothetical protein